MSQRFLGMVFAGAFLLVAGHGVAQASTPRGLDVIERIDQGTTRAGAGAGHGGITTASCGGNTNTTVLAQNNIMSGNVNGGNGGSVTVTLTDPDSFPTQLHLQAGDGGTGGRSGAGQGADQAEDLGEYAGQTNTSNSNNQIQTSTEAEEDAEEASEDAADAAEDIDQPEVEASDLSPDTITPTDPDRTPAARPNVQAGDGGNGGESGEGQGADQAEDLGEYAGQTNPVDSNNQIQTSTETGPGANAVARDNNQGVRPSDVRPGPNRPGPTCNGSSGHGGSSGNTDTSLNATNGIVSGNADGGNGGDIYLIINAS
ncbi:hypothetical protein ACI2K4_27700 [Micromonospora sp. NPDC050397]|uniref:hypothetical protein n=1 Tax=Micromonospora sp. NPDC050397 TaxID=3364279 RepID=UPI00384D81A8